MESGKRQQDIFRITEVNVKSCISPLLTEWLYSYPDLGDDPGESRSSSRSLGTVKQGCSIICGTSPSPSDESGSSDGTLGG